MEEFILKKGEVIWRVFGDLFNNKWQKIFNLNLCVLMLMTYGLKCHLNETFIRLLGNGPLYQLGLVS